MRPQRPHIPQHNRHAVPRRHTPNLFQIIPQRQPPTSIRLQPKHTPHKLQLHHAPLQLLRRLPPVHRQNRQRSKLVAINLHHRRKRVVEPCTCRRCRRNRDVREYLPRVPERTHVLDACGPNVFQLAQRGAGQEVERRSTGVGADACADRQGGIDIGF
ncbi:hypothetical protein HBH56_032770 [Parastagonospora nodorum]|nr:hypothetical protein HBH56_032770 [Parastagonospora nodorum]KAH3933828.1 hypothetical protein HBH54_066670 [Parastagonospora nodorum]KAH3952663.1 hypothetical protein HBH53_043370 [Parastagonospora nodorum]KAH3979792.1 hypothetical protein HBH51_054400 [Parastagonospora nodorum]KAH4039923.1 hypothetical protein HBI09_038680 [Parastagonospora nodorum]